jgi:biotin carboxyl carrier protein
VPEPLPPDRRAPLRDPAERSADHAAIERLTEELLPALIAKLGATGLGEIEVREGAWGVRLRRPADGVSARDRRSSGVGRSQPGHAGHGHGPVGVEGHRPARAAAVSSNGSSPGLTPVGPGRDGHGPDGYDPDGRRSVATSPAVGVYRSRPEVRAGNRVRAGDRLGVVDMLGIPQEVVAPVDGIVGASLVDSGDAVEYGQELVVIEFVASA